MPLPRYKPLLEEVFQTIYHTASELEVMTAKLGKGDAVFSFVYAAVFFFLSIC